MISDRDSDYNTICKLFNFSKESSADINKRLLLEMAKNGEDKPSKKTKIGRALRYYILKSSTSYDPIFTKQIKKLRPDWFITKSDTAKQNKKILLKMAINQEDRPSKETKLGTGFCNYICKFSGSYDKFFDKQIRKLAPNWFVTQQQIANQKKKQLIIIAKSRKTKPHYTTKLGRVLRYYTDRKNTCYCAEFDKEIRKLRPDWFFNQKHFSDQKKKQLIKMAKKGTIRPNQKTHKLGRCLCSYTNKHSVTYDLKFDKEIRKLAPNWFVTKSEIVAQKKELLIDMAKNGKDRPSKKTDLGRFLISKTNKPSKSYCQKFDKQIRKLAPNWFVTQRQIAAQKRKLLIDMAKNGEDRPGQNTSKIGKSLTAYTCKRGQGYNEVFDKQIRKLRPDWFIK